MTLNGCDFDLPCAGDPDLVRDAAVGHFVKLGYELKGRTAKRAHLKLDGSLFATSAERHFHHVYVSASAGTLHFEFSTGIVASYWTDKDVAFARARAEAAVRAAEGHARGEPYRAAAEDEEMDPCPFCGKINLRTAPACTVCGAATRR